MNATLNQDTILVVDDSPETLSMINDTLEKSGLTCLVSIDPLQGLNIARKMQPDLILLDGLMPNISGFEFCRTCKSSTDLQDIPIIFMTGLSDSDNIMKAFAAGGVDYVTKPIDTSSLIARIRVHLSNAKIIRSTQLALDKAGQHVFAVNDNGELLWQTPEVLQSLKRVAGGEHNKILEKSALSSNWLENTFWPSIENWIKSGNATIHNKLQLHSKSDEITLEILNSNTGSSEILIRLYTSNQEDDCSILRSTFGLSAREADVLFWIAKGKTNREMGHILGISPRTINKHLEQVFKKLEVDNRTNAAAKAIPVLRQQ